MTERGDWMQTLTGVLFYPRDPRAADVRLEDIAHGLAMTCRFGGHTRAFYSVAEHSVRVSELVEELAGSREDIFWGLMHDASEAYLGDIVWPLKRAPELGGYRELEEKLERVICEAFGMAPEMPAIVKHADLVMLATEKRDLMRGDHTTVEREALASRGETDFWHCDEVMPHPRTVQCWGPYDAKALFLSRFERVKP